jgi:hypothetical protein
LRGKIAFLQGEAELCEGEQQLALRHARLAGLGGNRGSGLFRHCR